MPTAYPRHSITETPALAAVLDPLRRRLGPQAPSLGELLQRGAEQALREVEARDRANGRSLATFVDRLMAGPEPDLHEFHEIRHATRSP